MNDPMIIKGQDTHTDDKRSDKHNVEPELSGQAHGEANYPMNGNLEDTTPAGVLQVLSSQRETGAVRFLGESGCTVYLNNGELYFAESTETAEDLAIALVRPGRLTAEQWDTCTEAGYATETVGESLIETGSISREMLASIVLSVIYDPLIQLFRSPVGDYEFAPGVVHWIGAYRSFGVDAIVSEVRRRTREADEMAPVVPSLDALVRSARTLPETRGSVNLRRDDWEVVIAAAPGRTVKELAVELGRGRWSTARLVYRLATADLLMVTADDPFYAFDESDGPQFARDASSTTGPPPLDPGAFGTSDFTPASADAWGMPETSESTGWDLAESPEPAEESETTNDWDFAATTETDSWTTESSFSSFGEPTSTDDTTDRFEDTFTSDDTFAADDAFQSEATTVHDSDAQEADPWGASSLSAVPDTDDDEVADPFKDSGLHPDIAKALAESTYADSATAINAMAARLGAADDDEDDDDWDTGAGSGDGDDDFWASGDESGGESFDFIWKPAVWETGVESTPLPQREHTGRVEPAYAPSGTPSGDTGSADPAWLDSLYTQFMPGEGGTARPPEAEANANGEASDSAPKKRSLKRLMSAFKRM